MTKPGERRKPPAHLLSNKCIYCGAPAGELCRSKSGKPIFDIAMMHTARLTPQLAQKRFMRPALTPWPWGKWASDD
jgi:hypothetical protein